MTVRGTALSLVLGLTLTSGCYSLHTSINEHIISCRNHEEAKLAWWSYRHQYDECEPFLMDFGGGFMAGYEAIANGSEGCAPTLPPQRYWGVSYQTGDGRARVASWYNGYAEGVTAAQTDGVQGRNQVITSQQLYSKQATAPYGETAGMEPTPAGQMLPPLPEMDMQLPAPVPIPTANAPHMFPSPVYQTN